MGDRPGRSITGQLEASLDTAQVVLIGGSLLSIMFGLLGIAITKRENTPVLAQLNEAELKSYRIQRLMTEGIAYCTLGKHNYRPGPKESTTVCRICLTPAVADQVIGRAVGQAQEGRQQPWNRRTR